MTTTALRTRKKARFKNGAEWWHAIGDVPLHRVVFDPKPGDATLADFIRSNDGDDKRPCELIDGTLVEKVVGIWESMIASRIAILLGAFVNGRHLGIIVGEQGPARTTPSRIRMPDLSFFAADQFPGRKIPPDLVLSFAPVFVVEVLSRGNTKLEMRQKRSEHFASGVRLMWVVDPKRQTISIFDTDSENPSQVVGKKGTIDGGDVISGFKLKVADLFVTNL